MVFGNAVPLNCQLCAILVHIKTNKINGTTIPGNRPTPLLGRWKDTTWQTLIDRSTCQSKEISFKANYVCTLLDCYVSTISAMISWIIVSLKWISVEFASKNWMSQPTNGLPENYTFHPHGRDMVSVTGCYLSIQRALSNSHQDRPEISGFQITPHSPEITPHVTLWFAISFLVNLCSLVGESESGSWQLDFSLYLENSVIQ